MGGLWEQGEVWVDYGYRGKFGWTKGTGGSLGGLRVQGEVWVD